MRGRPRRSRGSIAILGVFTLAAVLLCSFGIFAVGARMNRQAAVQNVAESAALAAADRVFTAGLPAGAADPPYEVERALVPAGATTRWSFGEQPDARHVFAWVEVSASDAPSSASFLTPRPIVMRARAYLDELRLGSATRSFATGDITECTRRDRRGRCTRTEKVACTIGFAGPRPPSPFTVVVRQGDGESFVARAGGEGGVRGNRGELRWFDRGGDLELSLRVCDRLDGGGVLRLRFGPTFLVAAGDPGILTLPAP